MKRLILSFCLYVVALGSAEANTDLFSAETRRALQAINGSLMTGTANPTTDGGATQDTTADAGIGTYQSTPEISAKVRRDVAESLVKLGRNNGMDDATAAQLENQINQADAPGAIWPILEGMGYPRNNQITALCYWLLVNWDIVQGRDSTPDEIKSVYQQLTANYSKAPELSQSSDADKQYTAEALLWFATIQGELHMEAKKSGDAAQIENARREATSSLQQMGFDPTKMQMTPQGLLAR